MTAATAESQAAGIIAKITTWTRRIALLALSLLILAVIAKTAGYSMPMINVANHETLAYLAGAYWLTK